MLHQVLCVQMSQQNSIVECKLHHLLDVACPIFFQMNVHPSYWSNDVLTRTLKLSYLVCY